MQYSEKMLSNNSFLSHTQGLALSSKILVPPLFHLKRKELWAINFATTWKMLAVMAITLCHSLYWSNKDFLHDWCTQPRIQNFKLWEHQQILEGGTPPLSPMFFIFLQFSVKIMPDNKLVPPLRNPGSKIWYLLSVDPIFIWLVLKAAKCCKVQWKKVHEPIVSSQK